MTATQVLRFTLTLSKLSLLGVRNNSCEPSGLLLVNEDIERANSKQKLTIVLSAPNMTLAFNTAFLLQNAMLVFRRAHLSAKMQDSHST